MSARSIVTGLVLLIALAAPSNADFPDPADTWTEYGSASEAQAAGWFNECGLSQLLVVDSDCMCGEVSVGCRATQARWQNRFGLRTSVDLTNVVAVAFDHYATWAGLDVLAWNLFVIMEPTEAEVAAGYDLKQIHLTFPKAESWTRTELDLAEGTWQWRSAASGLWFDDADDGTTELTTLVSLEWYLNAFIGIAIGDMMRIDDLALVTDATGVDPLPLLGAASLDAWPNPTSHAVSLSYRVPRAGNGRLSVFDARGRLVRTVVDGWLVAEESSALWDGRDDQRARVANGTYRLLLVIGDQCVTRPVTLAR